MTPQEQHMLDFLREQGPGAKPIVIAVGEMAQADQVYSAIHLPGNIPASFVVVAAVGLLSEYRRTMAPDCECGFCEAIDQALSLIHSAGTRRLDSKDYYQ